MPENRQQRVEAYRGGFLSGFADRVKLILRLLADPRVSPLIKLLPIGTFIYFVVPDLIPTPIDDAVLIWLGSYLFVELCPPDVVEEHMKALNRVVPGDWRDVNPGEEVIDGEYVERS